MKASAGRPAGEVGLTCLAALLLGASNIVLPFGSDQAEAAYLAVAAADGQTVYRDLFNVKPPLTHLVHGVALALFGRSMVSIRLLDILWQAATAASLVLIGRRLHGRGAGAIAGLLYALSYFGSHHWTSAQADGFLSLPLALGVLTFLRAREEGPRWLLAVSGAAVGTAVLFKYPVGLLLPLLLLVILLEPVHGRTRQALSMTMGFAAPLVAAAALLWHQGALRPFLAIQRGYVPHYLMATQGAAGYAQSALLDLARYAWNTTALQLSAAAALLETWLSWRAGRLRRVAPVLAWWVAAVAHMAVQNKTFAYHALPRLAPQCLIYGHLAVVVWAALTRWRRVAVAAAAAAALATAYVRLDYPWRHGTLLRVASGALEREAVYAHPRFGAYGAAGHSMAASLEVARYLAQRTPPAEAILVWGYEPAVYFLAGRSSASRFFCNFPFHERLVWPGLREQLLADLQRRSPLYIVVASRDPLPWFGTGDDSRALLEKFGALHELVAARYEAEVVIEDFTLYRRRA